MIKKITITLLAVLGCASAFAAHADEAALPTTSNVNLVAPQQEGSWSFGVQANYFQPNTDFNYAIEDTAATSTKVNSVNADYNWGWGADVTYHIPGDGRDVTLAFTQLNSSNSDSIEDASAKVKSNYNSADLSFGQLIAIGDRVTLHPFAGLRYTNLNYKATAQYVSTPAFGKYDEVVTSETLESKFQGIGPRLGSDAAVNLGGGFSVHGTLGVSMLIGSMTPTLTGNTSKYIDTTEATSIDSNVDLSSSTRVVPEADAKLSAMYKMDFNDGYALGLEAGWQATNYFNAIQDSTTTTAGTMTQYNDFFMQGPYARVQLDIA